MEEKIEEIQLQYEGYLNTPLLWKKSIMNLEQLIIPKIENRLIAAIPSEDRLGKRVERFVSLEFSQNKEIKILAENVQIINAKKVTLGELDCLMNWQGKDIHVEIVYKFYLYDENEGNTEIERWVGPNKKDSLIQKVEKLVTKQLPLIKKEETVSTLTNEYKIDVNKVIQNVYFKAQLFVPFEFTKKTYKLINNACIVGYYIHFSRLKELKASFFYLPKKIDWLVTPHLNVKWKPYEEIKEQIERSISYNVSTLCWLKSPTNDLSKIFIVWWR